MKRFIYIGIIILLNIIFNSPSFGKSLRIVSINIRYDTSSDGINRWDNRKEQLYKYIYDNKLDVFCLQEVLPNQSKEIKERFQNYSMVGRGRNGLGGEAVPIFYKTAKYDCVQEGTFWLSLYPDSVGSVGWGAAHPRIATWIILKDKRTHKMFMVVNTHLDHKSTQAQEMGMLLIKRKMNEIMPGIPIVMTGDLNCSSGSVPYEIALNNNPKMSDCYEIASHKYGVTYTFHSFGKSLPVENRVRYDFVFVTKSFRVKRTNIEREEDIDGVYMSDHNPVLCLLSY